MSNGTKDVTWDSASNFWKNHLQGILDKNGFYQAIARDEVPHIRIGRRILVPSDALEQMLATKQESTQQETSVDTLASNNRGLVGTHSEEHAHDRF